VYVLQLLYINELPIYSVTHVFLIVVTPF